MSWRSIAEQYYARIAELEQRGSDMSRARPDVAFDPEEQAFAAIRETNQRHADRIAELEAQVAHFQVEYQDEIGRTELIENITTLKAERDRAQADAIAMTSWANALAAEYAEAHTQWAEDVTIYNARIAELEAQVAWSAARIAELEGAKK